MAGAVFYSPSCSLPAGLIARYTSPPAPARTAAAVALFERDHAIAIRAGMIISIYALVFFVPFTVAISVQLKRIEDVRTPLTDANSVSGAPFLSRPFLRPTTAGGGIAPGVHPHAQRHGLGRNRVAVRVQTGVMISVEGVRWTAIRRHR